MTRLKHRAWCAGAGAAAAAVLLVAATTASAQGNLSTQGFGYPPGQLSARGVATGGAVGEVDPQSGLNPATPMLWGAAVLFGQYDPEFRRVTTPAGSSRTMTARFPGIGFSLPLGRRFATALSVSTYLDRTWTTRLDQTPVIGLDTVPVSHRYSSDGAINDVRLAVAYAVTPMLSIGVGGHAFTGENRIVIQQTFPDTVRFSGLAQNSDISYGGFALSAGVEFRIGTVWQFAASGRKGSRITAESGDSVLSRAHIPTRYGAGITYAGVHGAAFSARAGFEEWSSLRDLGTAALRAFDAWDYGVGADVTGPRVGRRVIMLRAGARYRTLPFAAADSRVKEIAFSTGFGIPIAIDRANLDIGLARAVREAERSPTGGFGGNGATGDVSETAYILSLGIRVRP